MSRRTAPETVVREALAAWVEKEIWEAVVNPPVPTGDMAVTGGKGRTAISQVMVEGFPAISL